MNGIRLKTVDFLRKMTGQNPVKDTGFGSVAPLRSLAILSLAVFPTATWAEVCDKERPLWNPADGPATGFDELLNLSIAPPSWMMFALTIIAVLSRKRWIAVPALGVSLLLTLAVVQTHSEDPTGIRYFAIQEGCIGPPHLFIALCAAICMVNIKVIWRRPVRAQKTGE